MSEHTPGPWRFERNVWNSPNHSEDSIGSIRGPRTENGANDWFIATLEDATEQEANAALIASAPETARERDELQALINLQHKRTVKADQLWREAHPGNDLVMPDLGALIDWLLERGAERDRYKRALERSRKEALNILDDVRSGRNESALNCLGVVLTDIAIALGPETNAKSQRAETPVRHETMESHATARTDQA
jgi:hypothetical protein